MRRRASAVLLGALVPALIALPAARNGPDPHPVAPTTHGAALEGVDPGARGDLRGGNDAKGRKLANRSDLRVLTPKLDQGDFSLLGVTWGSGDADGMEVYTRAKRDRGGWTDWTQVEVDTAHGPDPGSDEAEDADVRDGTVPLWAGPSTRVQVAVASDGALPKDLRLSLVNPGSSSVDSAVTSADAGAPAEAAVPQPDVITRAEWGADESMRDPVPEYGDTIVAGFIHHTSVQQYYPTTPEESPSIVRSIYAYHVNGRGWGDIGYNFLVDRFGQIFEGRYGGIDKPVIGAQAKSFNVDTFGVAALGDYDGTDGVKHHPNQALLDAYERVASYKLGLYDRDPHGTVDYEKSDGTVRTIDVINPHQAVRSTACPGKYLLSAIPEIRDGTAAKIEEADPDHVPDPVDPPVQADRGDFDGDGYADLVMRAPGEAIGPQDGAGLVTVVPGSADGPRRGASTGLNQDTPGVPGSPEPGDGFGWATAPGDFDGDGYEDLAVGAPHEILGSPDGVETGHGAVHVLYGSDSGIETSGSLWLTMSDAGVHPDDGDMFGESLETGDLDGDGIDDLVVGAPGAGGSDNGGVVLYPGSTAGLEDGSARLYTQGMGLPDDPDHGSADQLGSSLAIGDTDGDEYADLVIGAPEAEAGGVSDAGAVVAVHGGPDGLDTGRATVFTQDTPGVPGGPESGDRFGASVTLGHLDGSAGDDLVVGAPGEDLGPDDDTGMLAVLFAGGDGLSGDGARAIHQDKPGVPGGNEDGDSFGYPFVEAADLDGDGADELAVTTMLEDLNGRDDVGALTVLRGGAGGPFGHGSRFWSQNSSGVPGDNEAGDQFASSLDVLGGDGGAAGLVVGVQGENRAAGRVVVMSGGDGLLSSSGVVNLAQDTPGVPGSSERGDYVGF